MRVRHIEWAGVMALAMLSMILFGLLVVQVNGWYEDWRAFAHTSEFAGACSNPVPHDPLDPGSRPAGCDDSPDFEMWMFVPWLLVVGTAGALLALCWPKPVTIKDDKNGGTQ